MGMGFKFQMGIGMKSLKWEEFGTTKNLLPHISSYDVLLIPQTSKNRLTAPPSVAARPAILSSRDCSIAGYS